MNEHPEERHQSEQVPEMYGGRRRVNPNVGSNSLRRHKVVQGVAIAATRDHLSCANANAQKDVSLPSYSLNEAALLQDAQHALLLPSSDDLGLLLPLLLGLIRFCQEPLRNASPKARTAGVHALKPV